MKTKISFPFRNKLLVGVALGAFLLPFSSMASVTTVKSTQLKVNTTGRVTPVFKGKSQTIRVTGQFVDLCDNPIRVENTSGSLAFTVPKGATQGGDGSFVEFSLNSPTQSGRFNVRLKSGLANDVVQIEIIPFPNVSDVKVLNTAGSIVFENAFKANTDFLLRLTGTALETVTFDPSNLAVTVTSQGATTAGLTQRDITIRRVNTTDKIDVLRQFFKFGTAGLPITNITGLSEFVTRPFFRIYNKPNLTVLNSITGVFNRLNRNGCGPLNTGINSVIENPNRCNSPFGVPVPSATTPSTEKEVSMPLVVFKIKNTSFAPIFTPITIQVKNGINVLGTFTANQLIANQEFTVTFKRPENRKKLARHLDCPDCYEVPVAPFNWVDPSYTLVIDPAGQIDESNESDNSRSFAGTQTLP